MAARDSEGARGPGSATFSLGLLAAQAQRLLRVDLLEPTSLVVDLGDVINR